MFLSRFKNEYIHFHSDINKIMVLKPWVLRLKRSIILFHKYLHKEVSGNISIINIIIYKEYDIIIT